MRTREFFPLEKFERPRILEGTREGLSYVLHDRRMLTLVTLTFFLSTFAFNFNVTLPVLANKTLHEPVWVYSTLSALFGAGALVGALTSASRGKASLRSMVLGAALFTGSELLLAPVTSAWLAGPLLFFVGWGFATWSANSNTSVQLAAPDHLRGRIIGLYFYAFNGTASVAGLFVGWLCARGGTQLAFAVAGVVGLSATLWAALRLRAQAEQRAQRRVELLPD
jgi:MFS family permease